MLQNAHLWEIVLAVVVPFIAWGLRSLSAKAWAGQLEKALFDAAGVAAQRTKDKFLADILAARDATSDGGVEVTPKEMSDARSHAFGVLMSSLQGPLFDYAKTRGVDWVKGLIGKHLDALIRPALTDAPSVPNTGPVEARVGGSGSIGGGS